MNKPVFEIKKSVDKQFYFTLKAGNGEIIGTSEMYRTKQNSQVGIDSVVMNCEIPERFSILESFTGNPYFVLKSKNGRTILVSEIYEQLGGVSKGIASVTKNAPKAEVVDTTKRKKK